MNNPNINNYFNHIFQSEKHPQPHQLFSLKSFSSAVAAVGRMARPAMFILFGFLLPSLVIIATAQAKELSSVYPLQQDSLVIPQKTESIFSSKTENFFSFKLAKQLAACPPSQISYGELFSVK